MRSRDPQRVLATIRRTTAGSLLAAAVGSGVVAVHLAGDHASAAATTRVPDRAVREEQVPQPEPQAKAPTKETKAAKEHGTATRHHETTRKAPAPAQSFQPVAPVQPGSGPAQSGSGGS